MTTKKYNGWTNHATWNIMAHLHNKGFELQSYMDLDWVKGWVIVIMSDDTITDFSTANWGEIWESLLEDAEPSVREEIQIQEIERINQENQLS
jgi:hypothetical protein